MSAVEIRPFRRSDRDQLTELVNAHVEAVLPGVTVSPNIVLSQLEREPDEAVVDPWVVERRTMVAVRRDAVVGAAHLLRYGTDGAVGAAYRGVGEFRWVLFRPAPHVRDTAAAQEVGDAVVAAGIAVLRGWGVSDVVADVALPAPGAYGVNDRWPHLVAALERAGFRQVGHTEAVLAADVDALPRAAAAPLPGLELQVTLGGHATRTSALLDGRVVGFHEVQGDLTVGGTRSRLAGWADTWELWVHPDHRRRGIATWLVGHTADRLRFGGARRLLDHVVVAPAEEADGAAAVFLRGLGFRELARVRRTWRLGDGRAA